MVKKEKRKAVSLQEIILVISSCAHAPTLACLKPPIIIYSVGMNFQWHSLYPNLFNESA